jgi:hypothetical protein
MSGGLGPIIVRYCEAQLADAFVTARLSQSNRTEASALLFRVAKGPISQATSAAAPMHLSSALRFDGTESA